MTTVIDALTSFFRGYALICGVLALGIFFTLRLGFLQFRHFPRILPLRVARSCSRQERYHADPGAVHQPGFAALAIFFICLHLDHRQLHLC